MEKLNELKFFVEMNEGKANLLSSHFLAVKYGLKKVSRLQFSDKDTMDGKLEEVRKSGLAYIFTPGKKLFNHLDTAYVSKNKKFSELTKELDPDYLESKDKDMDILKRFLAFGGFLNYPECCIRYFLESPKTELCKSMNKIPKEISFLSNNLLYGVTNHFITSHIPCSYDCKKTLQYQKKLFAAIKKNKPAFANELIKYLRRPYVIFLNQELKITEAWEKRRGVVFTGELKNNGLRYTEAIPFEANTPYKKESYGEDKIFKQIEAGDMIKINSKGFTVFQRKKKIFEFINSKDVRAYWFNFI